MVSSTNVQQESSTKPPVYPGSAATLNEKEEGEGRGMKSQRQKLKKRNQHHTPAVVLEPNPKVRVYNVGGRQAPAGASPRPQAPAPAEAQSRRTHAQGPRAHLLRDPRAPPRQHSARQRELSSRPWGAAGFIVRHTQDCTLTCTDAQLSDIRARPCASLKRDGIPEAHL